MSNDWRDWIGLPHKLGADPRDGEGACCLVMAQVLHELAGAPFPAALVPHWLMLAEAGGWDVLRGEFMSRTYRLETRPVLAMTLLRSNGRLGIGVIVEENVLLVPHHTHGVRAVPISARCDGLWAFRKLK